MSFKNEDRPVFPLNGERWQKEIGHGVASYDYHGITKREYFAAMAMQGLCVNRITGELKKGECVDVAEMSILIADELLKQLES